MYAIILSFVIIFTMTIIVAIKARKAQNGIICCKKEDIYTVLENISDDAIIEIWIGGNTYEHKRARNY